MNIDRVRRHCMSFPGATENVQWGEHLVFKIAGRIFAVLALEPSEVWLSLKCSPDGFAELTERPGIIPAPYLARSSWIALESEDALSLAELKHLLRRSYELVIARLSKKKRAALQV